jgi:hypothetical protein
MTGVKSCVISAHILNLISTEYENVSFFTTFLGEVTLDRSDNSPSSNILNLNTSLRKVTLVQSLLSPMQLNFLHP